MPPAVIAAGVGAAASIGGSLLANKASSKATRAASQAATDNTAANNALTRDIYGQNKANIDPFRANGLQASNALNSMLLGTPQAAPQMAPQAAPQQYGAPMPASAPAAPEAMPANFYPWDDPANYGQSAESVWARMQAERPIINGSQFPQATQAPAQAPAQAPTPAALAVAGASPWDQFRNSTNYQFRLNEGLKGLNQGYAGAGLIESGAAMKGINNYAQQFASNELGNYMGMLGQQQQMGLSGANALAGVGTNMVGAVTANNNAGANAVANAALMNGAAKGQMYGGIANALGNFAGSFGSSYKR